MVDQARAGRARGASLDGASLDGASLVGASLVGAKWRGGIIINRTPLFLAGLRYRVTILDAHLEIGCQIHRLSAWEVFDDAIITRMDGRTALAFWRAFKAPIPALARADGRDFSPVGAEVNAQEVAKSNRQDQE